MTYQKREITVQITLVNSTFQEGTDKNTLTIKNCRCLAVHHASGGISGFQMTLTLWGLSLDHIAKITGPGILQLQEKNNRIKVWNGEDVFFEGKISSASADMNAAPDVPIELACRSSGFAQMTAVQPTEIKESMTFASAVKLIAQKVGLSVNNYAESFTVSPAVYEGNVVKQLWDLSGAYAAKKVRLDVGFDYVDILQYGKARDDTVVICGPDAGLIGYPTFNEFGISFTCMYSPKIHTSTVIRLTTDLPNGSGDWYVATATHEISSWVDGGPWFTHVICTKEGGTAN